MFLGQVDLILDQWLPRLGWTQVIQEQMPASPALSASSDVCVAQKCNMVTQTALCKQDISDIIKENETLRERLAFLERILSAANETIVQLENKPADRAITTKDMAMQTKKTVKFYTGFVSAAMLSAFLQLVLATWQPCSTCLDPEAQLILMLTRLRLGLLTQTLACRSGVSNSTVSDIFHTWIDVLATNMKRFIVWPSRRTLQANRPAAFQDTLFDGLARIIDIHSKANANDCEEPNVLSLQASQYGEATCDITFRSRNICVQSMGRKSVRQGSPSA